jgi:uncharacterized protein YmfQ (DUF2313 family)
MPIAALWPLSSVAPAPPSVPSITITARNETDFLAAVQALLPQGRAWSRDPAAKLTALLDGWARAYASVDARQSNLLIDAFPASTVELLPEWEATLGLPDPCLGQLPTIAQRQAQVLARIGAVGGQSIPYLIAFAAILGFAVGIQEFAPFRAGVSHAGDSVNGAQAPTAGEYFTAGDGAAGDALVDWNGGTPGFDWSFGLRVTMFNAASVINAAVYFSAGVSRAGDPLVKWGSPLLECELRRIAPAESMMIFAYQA